MPSKQYDDAPLSARELEVIDLAVQGLTDKEICRTLGITLATIRTHWVRLRAKQGTVNRAQAVATALRTAYRQSSAALRESEERYRMIVEGAKDFAIFMLDAEGRYASWNSGAQNILRYTEEEILGQPSAIIFTPEDRERGEAERELQTAREEGRAEDDRWHVRKGGERFWASGVVTPLWSPEGELRGYTKVLRDRTEIKRVQDALVESEERFRTFVQQANEGIVSFEFDEPIPADLPAEQVVDRMYEVGRLGECNAALAEMCGYSSCDEMEGMPLRDIWVRSEARNVASLREFVRSGYRISGVVSRERDGNGHLRTFTNSVTGTVEDGRLVRVWCIQTREPEN